MARQIKHFVTNDSLPTELVPFVTAINDAYQDSDDQRQLLELSLENVSCELNERNQLLKSKLSQLEQAHAQLNSSLGIQNGILESTGEAIFAFDNDCELMRMNSAAQALLDCLEPNSHQEKDTCKKLLSVLQLSEEFQKNEAQLTQGSEIFFSGVVFLPNSSSYEYHSLPLYANDNVLGRVWSFRDVTQQKSNEALIKHQAFHDALTGLPNRLLMLDRIEHAATFCDRLNDRLAILFIDLDHFKKINDTLGHHYGDKLLIEVAYRIKECLRTHDTLARFGGDEFVILLEKILSHQDATTISKRIISALRKPFSLENKNFHISCSIGISLYPQDSTEASELIRKSDLAMYHAKEKGRGTYEFFDFSLERLAQYQLTLENKLRSAISAQELTVYYQPKVTVDTGKIEGVEALLRWFPVNENPISPNSFIPVAERAGILPLLDRWVLQQACQQIKQWTKIGIIDITISVNLSAQQFNDTRFVENIQEILARSDVGGNSVELEITESMLMENFETANQYLSALRKIGIKVSIDDFGTGYSSLQYLQQLPIDIIKIDRSFIQKLEINPNDKSIVDAIISLSHSLNLAVVAEGVEETSSYEYLKKRHCDYIQGFFFYRPMSSDALTELLLQQTKKAS